MQLCSDQLQRWSDGDLGKAWWNQSSVDILEPSGYLVGKLCKNISTLINISTTLVLNYAHSFLRWCIARCLAGWNNVEDFDTNLALTFLNK